jgi:Helix-turn-helix domain
MTTPNAVAEEPRGILNPRAGAGAFALERPLPSADLAALVEHHWIVRWDLRGREPFVQETLPHPSVHLVLEPLGSSIMGVVTARFSRRLEGAGQCFGVKFRPGGFSPFARRPVADFTDRSRPIADVFAGDAAALERAVLGLDEPPSRSRSSRASCARTCPPPTPRSTPRSRGSPASSSWPARSGRSRGSRGWRAGTGVRALQRLFRRHVGVSPKWTIRRYRLHEAAQRLEGGQPVDQAALACELGYFDQAHFIKDFTALIGRSPGSYAAACAGPTSRLTSAK